MLQRRDDFTRIRNECIPVHLLDSRKLSACRTNGPQALSVYISEVKIAVHRLLRQQPDPTLFPLEACQFIHTFNRRKRAVTIEKDQIKAHPTTGSRQYVLHILLLLSQ